MTALRHFTTVRPTRALHSLRPLRASTILPRAHIHTTPLLRTATGYGDPQDEKIENKTPQPNTSKDSGGHSVAGGKPSSASDPSSGGTTDPEVGAKKTKKGKTGSAGGKKNGASSSSDDHASGQEIRETKKVGESPKNEEVGGAGVIGG